MIVADVEQIMEQWAPRWIAWEKDNVGLQVGNRKARVRKIHICLDVTEEIIDEARRAKADMIISHHPLIFRPLTSVTTADPGGTMILRLAEYGIALYSAHTNLDFTREGVSMSLGRTLGLKNIKFLAPLRGLMTKIAVFVPSGSVGPVMEAMTQAGAGIIGNYSHCSFQINGRGTFLGSELSNPTIGTAGVLETAEEVRLEMICPRFRVSSIVEAMKSAHPYDEVAYDLYPLDNESTEFGMGAIGELDPPQSLSRWLKTVRSTLRAETLRVSGPNPSQVRRVAVCGGSGSDLLQAAVDGAADVFVTADVRYHTFHDAGNQIALVDAGHWETEHPVLPVIASKLEQACSERKERVVITVTNRKTSPIQVH
ncbi:MAG: Nif3-like dinuclear metal center hexameric protein [Ignavibacteriales bacterium]|nr:Nif3-like dinuclear metal center hexameric protein [Ignavibacteriales bacterium]